MSSIVAGLVPPFSDFFYAVLSHYKLHALHLHPNSVLLLSIFTFYCDAFIAVMPSVALIRHFFYLWNKEDPCLGCANFVGASGSNAISRAEKKVAGFQNKRVLRDAKSPYPRLVPPTEMPQQHPACMRARYDAPVALLPPRAPVPPNPVAFDHGI